MVSAKKKNKRPKTRRPPPRGFGMIALRPLAGGQLEDEKNSDSAFGAAKRVRENSPTGAALGNRIAAHSSAARRERRDIFGGRARVCGKGRMIPRLFLGGGRRRQKRAVLGLCARAEKRYGAGRRSIKKGKRWRETERSLLWALNNCWLAGEGVFMVGCASAGVVVVVANEIIRQTRRKKAKNKRPPGAPQIK